MDIKLENGQSVKINIIKSGEIYEYYIRNVKIGVFDPEVMKDNFLMIDENTLQNTLGNELLSQISDGINSIGREEIKKEGELTEKISKEAEENGIENIKDITIVDLEKYTEVEKDSESDNSEDKDIEKEEQEEKKNKEITRDDVNIKQEVDLDSMANDMQNLRNWLGGNLPKESTKVVVLDSVEMNKMQDKDGKTYNRPSTRYALFVVDKNERVEPLQKYIPNLKQRDASGNNPTKPKYQINKFGEVEKESIYSEYEIGDKIVQIDNKKMGRIQLNIGQEEHGGNETLGVQMSDQNSGRTSKETRSVMGEYERNGEYTVNENLKEAKTHKDCEKKLDSRDIDGDPNTSSHNDLNKVDFEELATKWGFYDNGKPDENKAREYLEKEMSENPQKTVEENIDKLTDDFNDDFGGRGSRV